MCSIAVSRGNIQAGNYIFRETLEEGVEYNVITYTKYSRLHTAAELSRLKQI